MTIRNRAVILMEIATEAQTNPEYWKEFQYYGTNFRWDTFKDEEALLDTLSSSLEIRRKPFVKPTRKIGEYDVPYPVQEPLQDGERYWLVALHTHHDDNNIVENIWRDDSMDRLWLESGLIFKTKADANCLRQALLSLTRVTTGEQ